MALKAEQNVCFWYCEYSKKGVEVALKRSKTIFLGLSACDFYVFAKEANNKDRQINVLMDPERLFLEALNKEIGQK